MAPLQVLVARLAFITFFLDHAYAMAKCAAGTQFGKVVSTVQIGATSANLAPLLNDFLDVTYLTGIKLTGSTGSANTVGSMRTVDVPIIGGTTLAITEELEDFEQTATSFTQVVRSKAPVSVPSGGSIAWYQTNLTAVDNGKSAPECGVKAVWESCYCMTNNAIDFATLHYDALLAAEQQLVRHFQICGFSSPITTTTSGP